MVVDQYLHVQFMFVVFHFSFLDLSIYDSNYMVIDQYIHRPSLLSQFKFFRDAYIGSTCIVIEQWFMLYLFPLIFDVSILSMMIRLAPSFALSSFRLRIRIFSCCWLHEMIFEYMFSVVNAWSLGLVARSLSNPLSGNQALLRNLIVYFFCACLIRSRALSGVRASGFANG